MKWDHGLSRWYGGKAQLLNRLLPLLPNHSCFVDGFGGGGSVILGKPPSTIEVFNDLSKDIINIHRVLRTANRERLYDLLENTPCSRADFERCLEVLHEEKEPVIRAWAWLVVSFFGFSGCDPMIQTKGSFCGRSKITKKWVYIVRHLERVRWRFRNVVLESRDIHLILDHYDRPGTVFYLDPPYYWDSRVTKKCYQHEMTNEQHADLLDHVNTLKSPVMLSGYKNPLYREKLKGWRSRSWVVLCPSSNTKTKPTRTETVWLNY